MVDLGDFVRQGVQGSSQPLSLRGFSQHPLSYPMFLEFDLMSLWAAEGLTGRLASRKE